MRFEVGDLVRVVGVNYYSHNYENGKIYKVHWKGIEDYVLSLPDGERTGNYIPPGNLIAICKLKNEI